MRRQARFWMWFGIIWIPSTLAKSHNIFGISLRVVIEHEDARVLYIVDGRVIEDIVGHVAHAGSYVIPFRFAPLANDRANKKTGLDALCIRFTIQGVRGV